MITSNIPDLKRILSKKCQLPFMAINVGHSASGQPGYLLEIYKILNSSKLNLDNEL